MREGEKCLFSSLLPQSQLAEVAQPKHQWHQFHHWGQISRSHPIHAEGRLNRGEGNNARGASATGYGGAQNRVGNANPGQARQVKCYNCNGIGHIARNCTHPKRLQNSEYFKDKMLLMQA
ncbi:retrovirus-related pol polyprotein from transposon TNT 1-94 [Tanacetum coccineum]